MVVVDAHCHIGLGRLKRQTAEELLREMDRCGVERAVVCPVDQYIAVYNKEGNDYIAEAVRAHPDRLVGFASVNPWYGERGVEELERAVGMGLSGLKLHPALQGFFANDELVYSLIEKSRELGIPIYVHTNTPVHAMPFQVADLAEQFPDVPFVLGHMGFADGWTDVVSAVTSLSNVYLETSLSLPMPISEAVADLGADRVVFGSDSPESSLEAELYKIRILDLDEVARRKILGENIERVLEGGLSKVNNYSLEI